MQALIFLMQSSCEQSLRFIYKNLIASEANELLCSIHKKVLSSTPVTVSAPTVVRCSAPVTTTAVLTATQLLVTRQPGCITLPSSQLKIIFSSVDMLRSLNTCMQVERHAEEEEMSDRSRSPSPPHPIFNGPVVRYMVLITCFLC